MAKRRRGRKAGAAYAEGVDDFWRDHVYPALMRLVELDDETAAALRRRYRRLCERPGFVQLKETHPHDAVRWFLESVPGLTWTWEPTRGEP
jgi:hypothetical protein